MHNTAVALSVAEQTLVNLKDDTTGGDRPTIAEQCKLRASTELTQAAWVAP